MIHSYRELPLGKYLDIIDLVKDESMEEIDRRTEVISILSGIDTTALMKMPIPEYTALSRQADFLSEEVVPTPHKNYRHIELGGFNLKLCKDIDKLTTAQYIDFQTYSKEGDARIVEILGCFLVPEGYDYNEGYDIADVYDALRNELNVVDAVTIAGFFLTSLKRLMGISLIYSRMVVNTLPRTMRKEKKILKEELKRIASHLRIAGDGSAQ